MLRFSYFPATLIIDNVHEDIEAIKVLRPWLRDLGLVLKKANPCGADGWEIPIYPSEVTYPLNEAIWSAITAGDVLWTLFLCMHLHRPADLYEILDVVVLLPEPQGAMQLQAYMSARDLMGL
jgi:hypothetical protein